MTRTIFAATIIGLMTAILITGTIPIANADTAKNFEDCPPPDGTFVKLTTTSGEKFFEASSYDTSMSGEPGTPPTGAGTITKGPDDHSSQINELVGQPVSEIVIVDCHIGKPSYRYTTTLTGVQITSVDQSGSSGSPPTESINFNFEERTVQYEQVKPKRD